MPEGHGAVTHYVAPENVENYTTVLELSMAVALEDLVEFAKLNSFVLQRYLLNFVSVFDKLLFVGQERMVDGYSGDLLHIFKGQCERLFFAVPDIFPECIVFARLTHSFLLSLT